MTTKNPTLQTMIEMAGSKNVVTVHRVFVDFTGELRVALLLEQLLYWSKRGSMRDGWIAKSDGEFGFELALSQYAVKQARNVLIGLGIVKCRLKKWAGTPTIQYQLQTEVLDKLWVDFLSLYPGDDDELRNSPERLQFQEKWSAFLKEVKKQFSAWDKKRIESRKEQLSIRRKEQMEMYKSANENVQSNESLTETTPETTPIDYKIHPTSAKNALVGAQHKAAPSLQTNSIH